MAETRARISDQRRGTRIATVRTLPYSRQQRHECACTSEQECDSYVEWRFAGTKQKYLKMGHADIGVAQLLSEVCVLRATYALSTFHEPT